MSGTCKHYFFFLQRLEPNYCFVSRTQGSFKFYSPNGSPVRRFKWKYPFIDIFSFDRKGSEILEHHIKEWPEYRFPTNWVFPTVKRPYNGLVVEAPRKTLSFLAHTYNMSTCLIGHYSHRNERGIPAKERGKTNCLNLKPYFPFVKHVPISAVTFSNSRSLNFKSEGQFVLQEKEPDRHGKTTEDYQHDNVNSTDVRALNAPSRNISQSKLTMTPFNKDSSNITFQDRDNIELQKSKRLSAKEIDDLLNNFPNTNGSAFINISTQKPNKISHLTDEILDISKILSKHQYPTPNLLLFESAETQQKLLELVKEQNFMHRCHNHFFYSFQEKDKSVQDRIQRSTLNGCIEIVYVGNIDICWLYVEDNDLCNFL